MLALQPAYGLISSQVARAIGSAVEVRSEAELRSAAANTGVNVISVKASFATTQKVSLSGRNVTVDGNGHTITLSPRIGWHGDYVFQAYKNTVEVKNLALTGGDAAIYANGAVVRLAGSVDVSGNEYGGIEVSRGDGVTTAPALIVGGGASVVNTTEATAKPTVWVDHASTAGATISGGMFTRATHIGNDQDQYYLNELHANTAVRNTTLDRTYDDLALAIAAAGDGDNLQLVKDVQLSHMLHLTKPVVIDGGGRSIIAEYSFTQNGVDNAVLMITGDNVTVKNVTVTNVATGAKPHGIVAQGVIGTTLSNLTLSNGRAGLIVNGSNVTATDIRTENNSWYGINVDKPGAVLAIAGDNSHNDAVGTPAIFGEDASLFTVIDTDGQYTQTLPLSGMARSYVLTSTIPVSEEQQGEEPLIPFVAAGGDPIAPIARVNAPTGFAVDVVGTELSQAVDAVGDDSKGEVLGSAVEGSGPLEQTAALSASVDGWKLWGVAWYWIFFALMGMIASWWLVAALRGDKSE